MDILKKSWVPNLSRNLPIWHSGLCAISGVKDNPKYKLPGQIRLYIHRGTFAEFYLIKESKANRVLEHKLDNESYIVFLNNTYQKNCRELIRLSKAAASDPTKLKRFFRFYAYCSRMLDITATASKIVTDKINELIKDYSNQTALIEYYSQPKRLGPIQRLEKELDELSRKMDTNKLATRLYNKYYWIPVNFVGNPWDLRYFVKLIKNHRRLKKKQKIKKPKVKLSPSLKYYLKLLGEIAGLNEYRKEAFTRAIFTLRPLFHSLSLRYGLNGWQQINYLLHHEIQDLVAGRSIDKGKLIKLIEERHKPLLIHSTENGGFSLKQGLIVTQFEKKFKIFDQHITEIHGTIANKGKVTGRAKIILTAADFSGFKTGDILVARMTSVDFIPIMKRAAAYVTDEGGLACHAAIISREYGKPCIIGTKIATRIFKDGDLVEVDAEKGIVRKV